MHRKGKEGSRGREEGRDAAPREMHNEPGSKSRHETEVETDTQRHRGREKQTCRETETGGYRIGMTYDVTYM